MILLKSSPILLTVLALAACVSGPNGRPEKVSAGDACAAGRVLTCEVSTTGRIVHGSFSKNSKSCSCEDGRAGPTIIPGIQQ